MEHYIEVGLLLLMPDSDPPCGACVEVSTGCSPSLLGWPLCVGPLHAWLPATAFHGVWDSAGPACPDCYWSAQLRRQWTTNMEQSASRSSNTRYDSVLFQASSQGTPVSAVVYAAADWWLSTVRPAPLWLFNEFGAVYKYSDLLTYSLQMPPRWYCGFKVEEYIHDILLQSPVQLQR